MTISNISSETTGPIVTKFYIEPSGTEETKICSSGPGQMTNMEAMPVDKPLKIQYQWTDGLEN